MKQTINLSQFRDAFKATRPRQFTYEGLEALYNWLIESEDCDDTETELDVIAFCCEYSEYQNLEEFQDVYGSDDYVTIEDVENATTVIPIKDDRFIIQDF